MRQVDVKSSRENRRKTLMESGDELDLASIHVSRN